MEVSDHSLPYPFEFPVEWPIALLGNVSDIKSGVTLGRPASTLGTRSLPYLRVANVQDGFLDLSEIKEILVTETEAALFRLFPGDVLMIEGGDFDKLGRGTVWRGEIPECLHQNHVFRVRVDQSRLLPFFLSAFSASDFGRRYFLISSKQTTNLASINSSQLKRFPLPLPPLPQQRKIARILTTLDNVIEKTEALIAKYQAIKQGLMHDLFTRGVDATGKLRLPQSEAPELYKQSELGWIPKEWELRQLRTFLSYLSYGFTNPMPETEEGPWMVTAANVSGGAVQYETCRHTSSAAFNKLLTNKSRPLVGDILLTKDGTLGRIALVDREGICINQSVAVLRPNGIADPAFLKLLLQSPAYQKKMLDDAGGSTIKHIYITVVDKMLVATPQDMTEQLLIAQELLTLDRLLLNERSQLNKLAETKTGLMQDLLTGKVPVKADEPEEITA